VFIPCLIKIGIQSSQIIFYRIKNEKMKKDKKIKKLKDKKIKKKYIWKQDLIESGIKNCGACM
jgi:hypothetical protein